MSACEGTYTDEIGSHPSNDYATVSTAPLKRAWRSLSTTTRKKATTWSPIVLESIGIDLDETEDALIAHLALPGLSNGDFKVEVTEDRLVIRGGKKDSRNKRRRGYSRFEESQATFAQAISLPCQIDRDRVEARFKNGLLTVTMPKRAK